MTPKDEFPKFPRWGCRAQTFQSKRIEGRVLQCNMTIVKQISLLLLLVPLFGCANQLQRPDTSQTIAEKEQQEQKKETEPPTFTYRPGG